MFGHFTTLCMKGLIHHDTKSSFEELLEIDSSVSIHCRNLRTLAIEMYKIHIIAFH